MRYVYDVALALFVCGLLVTMALVLGSVYFGECTCIKCPNGKCAK